MGLFHWWDFDHVIIHKYHSRKSRNGFYSDSKEKDQIPSTEQYLEIVDCTTQEPAMRRVTEVTNVYNPHKYTNPCNNLNLHQIFSMQFIA